MEQYRPSSDPPLIPQPAADTIALWQTRLYQIGSSWIEGIYLMGSIPLQDFQPYKSDIDLLILCKERPSAAMISQIDNIHLQVQKVYRFPLLNGVYLTRENLQTSNLPTWKVLHFHEGKVQWGLFDMGPVALYELKTIAHTLIGVPTNQLPINIHRQQVNDFMHENINSYWRRWISTHSSLSPGQLLLILLPALTEWAVLGVSRQVYTLQSGKIGSKTEAGYACLGQIPTQYQHIIQEAIQIRRGKPNWYNPTVKAGYHVAPSLTRYRLTIDCVNYLIELFNRLYAEQKSRLFTGG